MTPTRSGMPRRRRIAMVTDSVAPYHRGGKESRTAEISRRLARTDEVRVYTMNWWQGERCIERDGVIYEAICPYRPLYVGDRRSIRTSLLFAICCLRLLGRRFDVIEADHMPYLPLFPLKLVALVRRTRLVVTWHEVWGQAYWRRYLGVAGRLAWWLERAAMLVPDHIVAASHQTAERLTRHTQVPITVAPNGVDLASIEAAEPIGPGADLVVVGRMMGHKRLDLLIEAISLLQRDGIEMNCRIIGNGPDRELLTSAVDRLGMNDSIEFLHGVDTSEELYGLMKSARVFAFPSEREGFGIAVLEAQACSLPVVVTDAPDNLARHLVTESWQGVVTSPEPAAFAAGLQAMLTEPPQPPDEERRRWLRQYDWEHVADSVHRALVG